MLRAHLVLLNQRRARGADLLACRALLLALGMLAAASPAPADEPDGDFWHRNWSGAWEDSQAHKRPIVLFITTGDCYHCDRMSRDTYHNDQVLEDIRGGFVLASIKSERYPQLLRTLKVQAFPTTVIIAPDAQVIDAMTGYIGPEEMRTRLKAAEAKATGR
jgi:thioredoxin-related protein